jgi:ankyrin repeat protein
MKRILFSIVYIFLILAAFAKADVADKNAKLLLSVKDGSVKDVQTLLAEGANPNTTDDHGVPALMWAANNGHTEVVKLLLEKGADVNVKTNDGKWTSLGLAKLKDHTGIVQLLEKAGAKE